MFKKNTSLNQLLLVALLTIMPLAFAEPTATESRQQLIEAKKEIQHLQNENSGLKERLKVLEQSLQDMQKEIEQHDLEKITEQSAANSSAD